MFLLWFLTTLSLLSVYYEYVKKIHCFIWMHGQFCAYRRLEMWWHSVLLVLTECDGWWQVHKCIATRHSVDNMSSNVLSSVLACSWTSKTTEVEKSLVLSITLALFGLWEKLCNNAVMYLSGPTLEHHWSLCVWIPCDL